jgi:hypothetical protein
MANFPVLKSGAMAQYPLAKTVRYKTHEVRFLDGSRQRYSMQGRGLRQWTVALDSLDDQELSAVAEFAEEQRGAAFAFVDPVTGESIGACRIAGEGFDVFQREEMAGQARLVIQEIL